MYGFLLHDKKKNTSGYIVTNATIATTRTFVHLGIAVSAQTNDTLKDCPSI